MLAFFRINDPYRLIILFVVCTLIRLPFFIFGDFLTIDILNWHLIGEAITDTEIVLYKDFHEPIAPFAAWIYALLDVLFGRSLLVYQILGLLLVTYQFSLFNNIMFKSKAFNENSYLPALFYALLMHLFFDFFVLSPALISLTFVLLVLDNIYLRIENKLNDRIILKTGILMGFAILFYLPSVVFLFATLLSLLLFTSMILRRYLLFFYGIMLPFLVVLGYYFLNDAASNFVTQWMLFTFSFNPPNAVSLLSLTIIFGLPLLLFLVSLYRTFTESRFTNYQVRVQQVMFIMFLFALIGWWLTVEKAPYQTVIFIPFMAFFVTHYIKQFRSRLAAEIVFAVLSALILSISYMTYFENSWLNQYTDFHKLKVKKNVYTDLVAGKRVWYSGSDKSIYQHAYIGTSYFHQKLSETLLLEMDSLARQEALFQDIKQNKPEVIIDTEGQLPDQIRLSPLLKSNYLERSSSVFLRRGEKN